MNFHAHETKPQVKKQNTVRLRSSSQAPLPLSSIFFPCKADHYPHFHQQRIIWSLFVIDMDGIVQYVLCLLTTSFWSTLVCVIIHILLWK